MLGSEPMPGLPVRAPTEALLTIAPLPCRAICRSLCFMQLQTPRKLIPITRSQSSRVLSAVGTMRAMTPALLKAGVQPPELSNRALNHPSYLRVITEARSIVGAASVSR